MSGKTSNTESGLENDVRETQLGNLTESIGQHAIHVNTIHRRLEALKARLAGAEPDDRESEPRKDRHAFGHIDSLTQSHEDINKALEAVFKTLQNLEQIV
jgi:hypothetical protein